MGQVNMAVVIPAGENIAYTTEEAMKRWISGRRTAPSEEQLDQLRNAFIEAARKAEEARDKHDGAVDVSIGIAGGDTLDPYDFKVTVNAYEPQPLEPVNQARAREERAVMRARRDEADQPKEKVAQSQAEREREAKADAKAAEEEEKQAKAERQKAREAAAR